MIPLIINDKIEYFDSRIKVWLFKEQFEKTI
jgi:hypothetical protein